MKWQGQMQKRMEKTMSNKWSYIYGNECDELWEHFDMPNRNRDDRMVVKLVDFQSKEDYEEEDDDNS